MSWTVDGCTTSRRSTRSPTSCRRTWTQSGPSSNSKRTVGRACKRRTAPSVSGPRSDLRPTFISSLSAGRCVGRSPARHERRLRLALEALNPFRGPLDHSHERVELPLARDRAADEPPKHDPRTWSFVRRIVRCVEEGRERLVEFLLLEAGRLARSRFHRFRGEQFVQKERHRVREVEDRILVGRGDRDEEVAARQLIIEQSEVFPAKEEGDPTGHLRNPDREIPRCYRNPREPFLALRV